MAYLPLAYGSQMLGVIALVGPWHSDETGFSQEEKRVIQAFANHVALAVEYARLIEEAAGLELFGTILGWYEAVPPFLWRIQQSSFCLTIFASRCVEGVFKRMADLLFVGLTLIFFGVTLLYIYGCEWFVKERRAVTAAQADYVETTGERTGNQPV